jgi:hypothetical protein
MTVLELLTEDCEATRMEPIRRPIRMPIRIEFHTLHKGDHNEQTNIPFLQRRHASGARRDGGG